MGGVEINLENCLDIVVRIEEYQDIKLWFFML